MEERDTPQEPFSQDLGNGVYGPSSGLPYMARKLEYLEQLADRTAAQVDLVRKDQLRQAKSLGKLEETTDNLMGVVLRIDGTLSGIAEKVGAHEAKLIDLAEDVEDTASGLAHRQSKSDEIVQEAARASLVVDQLKKKKAIELEHARKMTRTKTLWGAAKVIVAALAAAGGGALAYLAQHC